MAVQLSTGVRNGRLDSLETTVGTAPVLRILSGAAPANCAAAETGTILAELTLPSDWLNAAAGGQKTIAGTWQDAAANNNGTAGYFRIYESTITTCHMQGTVTGSGGGGDIELNNTSINVGQQVTITAFTLTSGNA